MDFVFSAVDMTKDEIRAIEEAYAKTETPVVSNNSAHRWTPDVPMVMPEINPEHLEVIEFQKKRLGTTRGFIAVKPNCSIQSYTPGARPPGKSSSPTRWWLPPIRRSPEQERPLRTGRRWWKISSPISAARKKRARRSPCVSGAIMRGRRDRAGGGAWSSPASASACRC